MQQYRQISFKIISISQNFIGRFLGTECVKLKKIRVSKIQTKKSKKQTRNKLFFQVYVDVSC